MFYNFSHQILKHEWPKKWPTFVSDIVGASKANESLCQNNMVILKLLRYHVLKIDFAWNSSLGKRSNKNYCYFAFWRMSARPFYLMH